MWFPIPTSTPRAWRSIRPFLDRAVQRLDGGEHLLVHCGAGVGRAGTVAVCLLMLHGLGRDDALALVAAHRPMAGPEVGAQRELVDALAATLR